MRICTIIFLATIGFASCTSSEKTIKSIEKASPYKKIDVALLGVWHFNPGSTNDARKINTDILNERNQKELTAIRKKIAAYNPQKIFIEFDYGKDGQSFLDSLYTDFVDNEEFDYEHPPYSKKQLEAFKRTEHIQLSFKLAKMLGHKKVYGADHYASVSTKPIKDWKAAKGGTINAPFFDTEVPVDYPDFDSLLKVRSITDILLYLNSINAKKLLQDEYFSFNLKHGDEENYPGVDYALNWHKRNMRIYNNILRRLDYKIDERILVIFAGSHTSILQDYFNNNLLFTITPASKLLGK
jgi:hypothetical protein